MRLSTILKKAIASSLTIATVLSQSALVTYAAPGPKFDVSVNGFAITGAYTTVSGQPTAVGAFSNGSLGAYVEGSCIPMLITAKNKEKTSQPLSLDLIYTYHHSGASTEEIGVDHLRAISHPANNTPSGADNLNDFTYSGSDLTSVTAYQTTGGTSVTTVVTGPFSGDAGTSAVTTADEDRHYTVNLVSIPADETVNVLFCAQLGTDASDFPGASMKVSAGNGAGGNINIDVNSLLALPSLTIEKTVVGGTAQPSDFSFTVSPAINGVSNYSIASGESSVTIANVPLDGAYTVTESNLAGYRFASGVGTNCAFGVDSATGTATLAAGKPATSATCSFTNEALPVTTLTVDVVIPNDNGGTLSAASVQPYVDLTAVTDGVATEFAPGDYMVSIDPVAFAGYTVTFGGDCMVDGYVVLTEGEAHTCTVTIDDIAPTLTVIKNVINNTTGESSADDFTLVVTNNGNEVSSITGSETGQTISVNAGSYSVTEPDTMGYISSPSAGCAGTITLGESKTCTITNTDEIITPPETGAVTVNVVFTNDNNGQLSAANSIITVTGDSPSAPSFGGDTAPRTIIMGVGNYSIGGNTLSGYNVTYAGSCEGELALNDEKTCTITYDDIPAQMEVLIDVVNTPYNGSATAADFTVSVSGAANPSSFTGAASTPVVLGHGVYDVTVGADSRYDATYSADCTGTVSGGEEITCTITLTAKPAFVTVRKVLTKLTTANEDTEGSFNFIVNSDAHDNFWVVASASGTALQMPAGEYSVTEDDNDGIVPRKYNTTYSNCNGSIENGETITCTVTNTERTSGGGGGGGNNNPGALTVTTVVTGGSITSAQTQYQLFNNGATTTVAGSSSGVLQNLIDGAYAVTPVAVTSYTVVASEGCVGTSTSNATLTCTLTYTFTGGNGGGNGGGGGGSTGGVPVLGGGSTGGVVLGDTDTVVDACSDSEDEAKRLSDYVEVVVQGGTSLASITFKALTNKLLAKIMPTETELLTKTSVSNFIENGSKSTMHLGEGERAGVINSFKSIYGHYPETACDWQNVVQMSREQSVKTKVAPREVVKKALFSSVYKREATSSSADAKALDHMTYGMRPMSRNLRAEDKNNQLFKKLYGHYPQTADEWDLMRAMTYGLQVN